MKRLVALLAVLAVSCTAQPPERSTDTLTTLRPAIVTLPDPQIYAQLRQSWSALGGPQQKTMCDLWAHDPESSAAAFSVALAKILDLPDFSAVNGVMTTILTEDCQ